MKQYKGEKINVIYKMVPSNKAATQAFTSTSSDLT